MKIIRRLAGALAALLSSLPAAALAAEPATRLDAAVAESRVFEAPGTGIQAEVVTFGAALAPALLQVAPGETVRIGGWPVAPGRRADVAVTRFEIYAPEARIWKVEGDRTTEVPRSRMAFFRGEAEDDPETRIFVGVDPDSADGAAFQGLAVSPQGSFEIRPFPQAARGRGHLVTVPEYFLQAEGANGKTEPLSWTCGQDELPQPLEDLPVQTLKTPAEGWPPLAAALPSLHTVTIAVDTDNELMGQKFSDNTTTATNYVAALIAAMNVIYERDLNIRLLQGNTNLRVSTTPDPYSQNPDPTFGSATTAQLNEVSNYWFINYGGITRGLAMMLSGKSPNPNSSSGIASVNALCNTSSGYSFSQVFKFVGSTGATDAFVVGHELGHNFGSRHTHNPAGYNPPIDTCASTSNTGLFNCVATCGAAQCTVLQADGALACNVCPAPTTINGVPNVEGTLMSYCHLIQPFGSCHASNVFHPRTVDLITSLTTPKIGICVFSAVTPPTLSLVSPNHGLASGGTAVTLTGTNFQSGATVTFGGTPAASVTFNNATSLSVVTPARAAGTVNVVITNPDTGTVTGTNAYTFDPLPTLSALTPNRGTIAGGTSVAITGANFQNGATVNFGGTNVAVTFNNSTQLTVTSPAHATGTVGVTVTNPDGGAVTRTSAYFYTPPPAVTDFYTLTPCRVFDTRNPNGPSGGPIFAANAERNFTVAGSCGVPANAVAIMTNVTIINPTVSGYLSVDPGNAFFLGAATMTFQTGEILANNATLMLSTDGAGTVKVLNGSGGTVHVALDVTGYYAP